MKRQEHFAIEACVDFVRGVPRSEYSSAMQEHLTSGCPSCLETAGFLADVWTSGRSVAQDHVPEDWSRRAEDILGSRLLAPILRLPTRRALPVLAGGGALAGASLRTASQSNKQLFYESKGCAVTLVVDEEQRSRELSIVGQITDQRGPERPLQSVPIFLLRGPRLMAAASTNEFGEFQLTCTMKRKLLISFPFEGCRIDVALEPPSVEKEKQQP